MKTKTTIRPFSSARIARCPGSWTQASLLDATRNTQHATWCPAPRAPRRTVTGFTLIELLIVIAIIVIIAALAMPTFNIVVKKSVLRNATAERDQLETAIENYHAKFGYYPPSNSYGTASAALTNQLYYELSGTTTTNTANGLAFTTLDNLSTVTPNFITEYFGVSGFMNCTKGSGDDALIAQSFLPALKPAQVGTVTNGDGTVTCVIVTAAHSDGIYNPMPAFASRAGYPANPWRYVYPGVNNPSSYDLWIQIYIGGKTNLICNWFNQPKVNYPMP